MNPHITGIWPIDALIIGALVTLAVLVVGVFMYAVLKLVDRKPVAGYVVIICTWVVLIGFVAYDAMTRVGVSK